MTHARRRDPQGVFKISLVGTAWDVASILAHAWTRTGAPPDSFGVSSGGAVMDHSPLLAARGIQQLAAHCNDGVDWNVFTLPLHPDRLAAAFSSQEEGALVLRFQIPSRKGKRPAAGRPRSPTHSSRAPPPKRSKQVSLPVPSQAPTARMGQPPRQQSRLSESDSFLEMVQEDLSACECQGPCATGCLCQAACMRGVCTCTCFGASRPQPQPYEAGRSSHAAASRTLPPPLGRPCLPIRPRHAAPSSPVGPVAGWLPAIGL